MTVDTPHPDYSTLAPLRQIVRDVVAGEYTIHGKGTDYLARLSGMSNDEYAAYVKNTDFYPATSRTIQGLLGAAFRIPPVTKVPTAMEEWLRDIDLSGTSLDSFLKKEFEDKLAPGCYGIRIDMREGGSRPYFAPYTCENIINWRFGVLNGRRVLTRIVLRECEYLPTDDEFLDEERDVRLVLHLVDGRCRSRVFRRVDPHSQEWTQEILDPPNKNKELLDFIPFVLDGEFDGKPPLLHLASTNLGHYRRTADYVDAMLFSSKPQPYVAGVDPLGPGEEETVLRIGSRHAWRLPLGAVANYLQSSGAGIGEIRQALQDYESRMARLGAAVIEEPKEGVESAETARINQSGKASVLSHHVTVTSQAATAALRMAAWWGGKTATWDDPRITCTLNQDFIESRLSPTDLLSLIQSWQQRGISPTLMYNIQRGGLYPDGHTVEDEMELIDNEGPILREGEEENLDDEKEDTPRRGTREEDEEEKESVGQSLAARGV